MKKLALLAVPFCLVAGLQSASAFDMQPGEWSMQVTGQPQAVKVCITPAMVAQYKAVIAGKEESKDGCTAKVLESTDTKMVTDLKCDKPEGKMDTHIVVVKNSDTEVVTTTKLNMDVSGQKVSTDTITTQTFVSKTCPDAAPAK